MELFGLIVTVIFVLLILAALILPRFEERQSEEEL